MSATTTSTNTEHLDQPVAEERIGRDDIADCLAGFNSDETQARFGRAADEGDTHHVAMTE